MPLKHTLIMNEIYRFGERTSIRGINRIIHDDGRPILRALWVCAVTGAAGITIYQLWAVLVKYLTFQANVVIYELDMPPLFPDITVCKINPYSHPWHDPKEPTIDEYSKFILALKENITTGGTQWNLTASFDVNSEEIFTFLMSPSGFFSNLLLSASELLLNESTMITDLGYYSWSLNGFQNDSQLAVNATVSISYNPDYQICYKFHIPDDRAADVRAMTGIFYTLDFPNDLIHTFNPSLRVSESSGVNVIVHARGTFPDPVLAVYIAPGQVSTISLRASVSQRLGHPYDNCVDIPYLTESGDYVEGANRYSVDACYDLCVQRYVMQQCQCIDGTITFTEVELRTGLRLCGHMNMTRDARPSKDDIERALRQLDCKLNAVFQLESGSYKPVCRCPVPCTEYTYETSASSAPWPHRSFQLAFYDKYIAGNPLYRGHFDVYADIETANLTIAETLDKLNSIRLIEQNFLRLKVIFGIRGLESLNSTAALTWEGLLSNVGGTLSLWIGITVMTFFELVDLFYRLTHLAATPVRRPSVSIATSASTKNAADVNVPNDSANQSLNFDISRSSRRLSVYSVELDAHGSNATQMIKGTPI